MEMQKPKNNKIKNIKRENKSQSKINCGEISKNNFKMRMMMMLTWKLSNNMMNRYDPVSILSSIFH